MSDDKDREIERLKAQLSASSEPQKAGSKVWGWVFLAAVAAVVAFLAYAWNQGKASAQRAEAIAGACAAVTSDASEQSDCSQRMDVEYRGDLSPERTVNAAAEQVRAARP